MQVVTVPLEYTPDHFDIIPEIENTIVAILEKANPLTPNVQVHTASEYLMVTADKAFTECILTAVFSQLFYSIQQADLITVHLSRTDDAGIVEIQETGLTQTVRSSFDKSVITTDQPLIVCRQLMEDMGGEMIYLLKDKQNYFRLKFLLG